MNSLHLLLSFFLIFCSFFVLFAENPVHSVLFLILCFTSVSCILFLFHVEFLALLFLIIYVGAIAVLFLFVVMMLNVKRFPFNYFTYIPFIILFLFIFSSQIFWFLQLVFFDKNCSIYTNLNYYYLESIDPLHNINIFGQIVYNCFLPCVLLAGLILLIAMIGAIVLTLKFKSKRSSEMFSRQLSRSENFLTFLK